MKQLTKAIAVAGATAAIVAPSLATSAPAFAAARDGHCNKGEFCYYFNSNQKGSVSDFKGSVSNYGTHQPTCYEFKGKGRGRHKCIKNHAASVWNRSGKKVRVYYNTGYQGPYQTIPAHSKRNLRPKLKNDNASHRFLGRHGGMRDDYPYKGQSSGVDPWNFYKGQCTSFVAWRLNSRHHIHFTNHYKGQHFGNANTWDNAARRAKGVSVSGTPHVGDVAQSNAGTYGHVAWVAKVHKNGTVTVEEYNYAHPNHYGTRRVSKGSFNYIHFPRN